jgi:predicted ATPase
VAALAALCDTDPVSVRDLLAPAAAVMIVEESGARDEFHFGHDLIRATLYQSMTPLEQAGLHRDIGIALERMWGRELSSHLPELAHHFLRAGPAAPADKAAGYAERAGENAMSAGAYEDAASWFSRAVQALEAARRVDQDEAVGREAVDQVDLVEQRRVLDDQRVGCDHRLAQAYLAVVDPAERHHRRAHPLRAEARERLRVAPFEKGRDRQHLGARNHALAATAVYPYLEH